MSAAERTPPGGDDQVNLAATCEVLLARGFSRAVVDAFRRRVRLKVRDEATGELREDPEYDPPSAWCRHELALLVKLRSKAMLHARGALDAAEVVDAEALSTAMADGFLVCMLEVL